jgi:hypothetical protein
MGKGGLAMVPKKPDFLLAYRRPKFPMEQQQRMGMSVPLKLDTFILEAGIGDAFMKSELSVMLFVLAQSEKRHRIV